MEGSPCEQQNGPETHHKKILQGWITDITLRDLTNLQKFQSSLPKITITLITFVLVLQTAPNEAMPC